VGDLRRLWSKDIRYLCPGREKFKKDVKMIVRLLKVRKQ
jgi:hypothetical protein